jgi:hypothetical protein
VLVSDVGIFRVPVVFNQIRLMEAKAVEVTKLKRVHDSCYLQYFQV